ncbi:MAG: hypothetical protein ACE5E1_00645 [Phycisphaerae bacterium]
MHHGGLKLTLNTCTDPRLLDVGCAMDVLPALPPADNDDRAERAKATGTDPTLLVPMLVPPSGKRCISVASAGKPDDKRSIGDMDVSG